MLHAMSGAVAKEFVARCSARWRRAPTDEREVAEMHAASEELRRWTLGELERLRTYGQERRGRDCPRHGEPARAAAAETESASRGTRRRRCRRVCAAATPRTPRAAVGRRLCARKGAVGNAHAARADARGRGACSIDAWRARWIPGLKTSRTRSVSARPPRASPRRGATNPWLRPLARRRVAWRRAAMRDDAAALVARARIAALAPAFRRWLVGGGFARAHPPPRGARGRAAARARRRRSGRPRRRAALPPAASGTARLRSRRRRKRLASGGWLHGDARDARRGSARARARPSPRPRRQFLAVARSAAGAAAPAGAHVGAFGLDPRGDGARAWRGGVEARFKQRRRRRRGRPGGVDARRRRAGRYGTPVGRRQGRVAAACPQVAVSRAAAKGNGVVPRAAESTRRREAEASGVARAAGIASPQSAAFATWSFRVVETKRRTRLSGASPADHRRDLARRPRRQPCQASRRGERAAAAGARARSRRGRPRGAGGGALCHRERPRGARHCGAEPASAFAAPPASAASAATAAPSACSPSTPRTTTTSPSSAPSTRGATPRRRCGAGGPRWRASSRATRTARLASAFDGWLDGAAASGRARSVIARTLATVPPARAGGRVRRLGGGGGGASLRTQKLAAVVARWTAARFHEELQPVGARRRRSGGGGAPCWRAPAAARLPARARGARSEDGRRPPRRFGARARAPAAVLERWLRLRLTAAFDGWRATARGAGI